MSLMPPSGSISARTIGDVPNARLLATLSGMDSWGVVKNAFKPTEQQLAVQAVPPIQHINRHRKLHMVQLVISEFTKQ